MGQFKDLTGQRFYRLIVLKRAGYYREFRKILWLCLCDCGKKIKVPTEVLMRGGTRSCGCYNNDRIKQIGKNHLIDLSGKIFGFIKVIKRVGTAKNNQPIYLCFCRCGKKMICEAAGLKSGKRSCGCHLRSGKETAIERKIRLQLHKMPMKFKQESFAVFNSTKSIPDFYLPDDNLVIYCDGDYFHRLPGVRQRDYKINRKLKKLGYKVVRFWEKKINTDIEGCKNKILEVIHG